MRRGEVRGPSTRPAVCATALLLALAGCSGSLPDWHYGRNAGSQIVLRNEPGATNLPPGFAAPSAGGTAGPVASAGPGGPSVPGPGGGPPANGTRPPTGGAAPFRHPIANIYRGAADTLGITDDHISLCGHAALIYGSAFNITKEDLGVYWQMVNDSPEKIHGRTLSIDWKDDRYEGTEAAAKVRECIAQDPFFIIGGIGFDQIPFARAEAERGRTLYLHHMAIRSGLDRAVHSFSLQPTVEQVGTAFGEHIRSKYRGKKVGIIYRNSDYFRPGHDTGKAAMQAHVNIVKDIDVDKNQHVYNLEIGELQGADAEVVWIWESALAAAEIIQQAASQGYRPKWVLFPFQLVLDVIGRDTSLNPTIDGVATWPAYARGGYGNAYAQYGYGAEIRKFEEAMARYRPRTAPNDILWQVWIGSKTLHNLLLECGRACTRNKIAGMFLGGLRARVNPNCEANFGHPNSIRGRVGLHQFVVHETYQHTNGAPAFKTTAWCREHVG